MSKEPKQYLNWDDIEFSYGNKVQKVRMCDTIYQIVYRCYDKVEEVQLLSEDEKYIYFQFFGNFNDHIQLFNDLRLELVE